MAKISFSFAMAFIAMLGFSTLVRSQLTEDDLKITSSSCSSTKNTDTTYLQYVHEMITVILPRDLGNGPGDEVRRLNNLSSVAIYGYAYCSIPFCQDTEDCWILFCQDCIQVVAKSLSGCADQGVTGGKATTKYCGMEYEPYYV